MYLIFDTETPEPWAHEMLSVALGRVKNREDLIFYIDPQTQREDPYWVSNCVWEELFYENHCF